MRDKEQSLRNQKIQEEDVAYAAFHDTICDVGEELTSKYGECDVLSDAHLQIALDELDMLSNSVDVAYKILLDAALSPLSSRLKRCKENIETRITDVKNHLTSAAHTRNEQDVMSEACQIESNSRVISAATDFDEHDRIVIDDATILSNSRECDSNKPCPKNTDLVDDMTVAQDVDEQTEKDTVPGATSKHNVSHTYLDMTMLCNVDVHATEAEDTVCESRFTIGLKHRWRWKFE